jgi:hypothetical protein
VVCVLHSTCTIRYVSISPPLHHKFAFLCVPLIVNIIISRSLSDGNNNNQLKKFIEGKIFEKKVFLTEEKIIPKLVIIIPILIYLLPVHVLYMFTGSLNLLFHYLFLLHAHLKSSYIVNKNRVEAVETGSSGAETVSRSSARCTRT